MVTPNHYGMRTAVKERLGSGLRLVDPVVLSMSPELRTELDFSQGEWRDSQLWYFFANGRFYTQIDNYASTTSFDPVVPSVAAVWGRYQIVGEQRVVLEEDSGESSELLLLNGHRTLSQDGFCYDEVTWATEQLQQQTDDLGN